jgi:hypothetical protein
VGFDPRSGSAQPNPTQPGPALRAPGAHWRPHPPCAPFSLSLSFGFPAQQPPSPSSTSLSPWCPRNWRRRSPEFGPQGELSSPPLPFSLSPSPSSSPPPRAPSLSPARARPCPPRSPAARPRLPCPRRRPPPPPFPARCGAPRPLLVQLSVAPAPCSRGGAPAPPPACLARPPARPRPPARVILALGVVCVALAWPRTSPFTASAFPRAQTRARGDYFWLVVNVKLR